MQLTIGFLICSAVVHSFLVVSVLAQFQLKVTVPNDPDVDFSYGSSSFSELAEIVSVTSPAPNLILVDQSGAAKNKIAFRATLPACDVPITIIGKKPDGTIVKYPGTIGLTRFKPTIVNEGTVIKGDGDKLKQQVKDLTDKYDVVVVSSTTKTDPTGTDSIAIVLKDKSTGEAIPKDEAEKIINDKIKTTGSPDSIAIDKPDCQAACKQQPCTTVLALDNSVRIQEAVVSANKGTFYAGSATKLEHRCGKDIFPDGDGTDRVCTAGMCANGGSCATGSDRTSSYLCKCPTKSNEQYGPQCQLMTRSYLSTGPTSSAITHHGIPSSRMRSHSLTISFQHAGACKLNSGSLCTIVKLAAGTKELLKIEQGRIIEPRYNSATLPSSPSATPRMALYSDRYVQNKRWLDVTVSAVLVGEEIKASTVFCSQEVNPVCFEKQATHKISGNLRLSDVKLSIGGTYYGCFRSVRLNGRLVDLVPSSVTGDASLTREGCAAQSNSCSALAGGSGYTCGANSLCYGQLGPGYLDDSCSCRCTNSKRMTTELITKSTQCAKECSKDEPIVVTGASNHQLAWAMKHGGPISLSNGAPFKLQLRLRTRQANAPDMLRVGAASDGGSLNVVIKIQGDILTCCVASACYAFYPLPVNDGLWHEVFVRIAGSQLITRVDDYAQFHHLSSATAGIKSAHLSMELPNSCISGVRLSDIYMPTGDADSTQDSATSIVKLTASSGAKAGDACADPEPSCSCNAATEECNPKQWGTKTCRCRPGNKRYSGSTTCQPPPPENPCHRLGIKCPNVGGACTRSSTGKWLVCQ